MPQAKETLKEEKKARHLVVYRDFMDEWIGESVVALDKSGEITPMFLANRDGISLVPEINTKIYVIKPADIYSYPYAPYKVLPEASLKPPTLQQVWDEVYKKVDLTVDHERIYKLLITDAIIATYLQDWFFTVPYVIFVGDNSSGKTHVLLLINFLAYRPLLGTDIPAADLIRYLPLEDFTTYTILEDEFQKVERNEVKLKVWKAGYKRGFKVPRIRQNTDKIEFFNPFGMKFAAGEKLPYDKGLNQRFIVIQMVEGSPQLDYWGDVDLSVFDELRLKLLLLRLELMARPKPELEVPWLRKRPRELFLPLLLTAYGTRYYEEVEAFIRELIEEKQRQIRDTFEAFLTETVLDLIGESENGLAIPVDDVWIKIKQKLDAVDNPAKPWVLETDLFGTISKQLVGRRLREVLGSRVEVRKYNGASTRLHVFEPWKLERAAKKYGLTEKLKSVTDTTDTTFSPKPPPSKTPSPEPLEAEKTGESEAADPEKNVVNVVSVVKEKLEKVISGDSKTNYFGIASSDLSASSTEARKSEKDINDEDILRYRRNASPNLSVSSAGMESESEKLIPRSRDRDLSVSSGEPQEDEGHPVQKRLTDFSGDKRVEK